MDAIGTFADRDCSQAEQPADFPRPTWTKPLLRKLQPGTPDHERARKALGQ